MSSCLFMISSALLAFYETYKPPSFLPVSCFVIAIILFICAILVEQQREECRQDTLNLLISIVDGDECKNPDFLKKAGLSKTDYGNLSDCCVKTPGVLGFFETQHKANKPYQVKQFCNDYQVVKCANSAETSLDFAEFC